MGQLQTVLQHQRAEAQSFALQQQMQVARADALSSRDGGHRQRGIGEVPRNVFANDQHTRRLRAPALCQLRCVAQRSHGQRGKIMKMHVRRAAQCGRGQCAVLAQQLRIAHQHARGGVVAQRPQQGGVHIDAHRRQHRAAQRDRPQLGARVVGRGFRQSHLREQGVAVAEIPLLAGRPKRALPLGDRWRV